MIGKLISHYKITGQLGSGGMGVVYKAEDTKLKRTVALKFLPLQLTSDAEAKERFIREAQTASSLEHPNICNIHEIDQTEEGRMFIVMACYEGQTLQDMIKSQKPDVEKAIDICIQIAKGLQKAHENGIVHRDIKPANIMITPDGQAKILDFGLAKLTRGTPLTKEHSTLGTVNYMSPEQVRGETVDLRSDVWSLGVLLYEMLTGQKPFQGDYDQSIMYAILNEQTEPLNKYVRDIPEGLADTIDKSLMKDPDQRYQNMKELLADLNQMGNYRKSSAILAGNRTKKFDKKRGVVFGIIFIVLVGILITISIFDFIPAASEKSPPERKKLVVLPFENLGRVNDDYFADGITDEITCRIASIRELGVISRKSAIHYAQTDKSTREIAEELGVDYVLEGTIRWNRNQNGSDRVRITPQLIRASDETNLWSRIYDREIKDIFEVQSEIAHNVVVNLGLILNNAEQEALKIRFTENLDAYHAFLQGRYYTSRTHFSLSTWQQGIESFKEATMLDSNFALAFAELAKAHARLRYLRQDLSETRLTMARESADRALHLAPDQAEVHLAIGYYYLWAYRDTQKAWEHLSIAEKVLANNVDILKGKAVIFEPQGNWPAFRNTLQRALELSPRDVSILTDLGFLFWITRKYPEAEDLVNRAILIAPNEVWPYIYKQFINFSWKGANEVSRNALSGIPKDHEWYIYCLFWQEIGEQDYKSALNTLISYKDKWISNKLWAAPTVMYKAYLHEFVNQTSEAIVCYDSARTLLEEAVRLHPEDPRYHSSLGIAYAGLGRKEAAVREGKRAVELLPLSKDAAYGVAYLQD
ncbi:MAG: tetratricopeptide repeat protein, partial [Calditrichales bacterium]